MERILLFIPAYNCEKQITRVLKQLDENVMRYIDEVVVIDNGSTDNTRSAVMEFIDNIPLKIILLANHDNYNLGGSHKVAFNYAMDNKFDYVVVLHGDDQGSIHDLMPVLESGTYKEYDCCLGARFMTDSSIVGYSRFRTFGNEVYNWIFSIVLRQKIMDLGSGLNMYNVKMLHDKFYIKFPDKLTFNYCMIMAANYYNHRCKFFPISWREEDQVSNVKLTNQAINVLAMLFTYTIKKESFIKSELRDRRIERYAADKIYPSQASRS